MPLTIRERSISLTEHAAKKILTDADGKVCGAYLDYDAFCINIAAEPF